MSKKYFYSHIVTTEDISLALGDMDMPNEDRLELINLAHENLHHAILDAVLDQLEEEDKKEFLFHLSSEDHEKAWILLKNKLNNAEDLILDISKKIKDEIHKDIKDASE